MTSTRLLPLLLACVALIAGPARAHNGRLALAPAVDGIVVDGDLSDWPDHLPRYPVANPEFGGRPDDRQDLSAEFRIAYSSADHRLLLAVEVTDESSVVPEPTGTGAWGEADGCEVYLDPSHGRLPGYQLSLWGREHSVLGGIVRTDLYQVEARHGAGHHVYEWWVDVRRLGDGAARLEPGVDLAFDLVVTDRDADGSFTWMSWGPHASKLQSHAFLGDLLVIGGGQTLGEAISETGDLIGRTLRRAQDEARRTATILTFLAGTLLAVTLLHLLLYLFQRESRVNLYHALFAGVTGMAIGLAYLQPAPGLEGRIVEQIAQGWVIVVYIASLLLLYTQFHGRVPARGRLLLGWLVLSAVAAFASPGGLATAAAYGALVASLFAICALVLGAVVRRREGAWTVGVSLLVFALCAAIVVFRLVADEPLHPALLAGVLLPLTAMSYRLARSVAGVHRDLARRYAEVESLSTLLQERNRSLELASIKIREQNQQVHEANRLKSDFLARMSHDLRTPLNAIIGYTRILLRRTQDVLDERQYRNLDNIRISADNLLALINDILDLSRIESGRTELHIADIDLRQLAADCAAAVESLVPPQVELVTELDGAVELRTDADRLRRVLMNLLGNAVKYTESGHIRLRLDPRPDSVELTVSDTGVGIPAEDLPYVFDEFRQVDRKDKKREGSGLGLAIARRSVEMLGGTIAVQSTVGAGSSFTVRLPRRPPDVGG